MSTEEENQFMEEAHRMSLDNPHVDKKINQGTTAPNCQPKHTLEDSSSEEEEEQDHLDTDHGHEIVASPGGNIHIHDTKSNRPRRRVKKKEPNGQQAQQSKPESVQTERERKLSYLQMAKIGYQELVNAIIRPPRADYKQEALGPPAFSFCGRRFTRTDFALRTKRGHNLQCSHWEPVERTSDRIPCVIYMHGNSSARVEVIPQLSYLLCLGLAVFSFDFAGSGKSDGDHVSLGFYEREDLMCVIAHLRATNVVSTIALWGRSMGAATSLMHGDRDPSIACMILDSPFADLTQLAEEMVEKGREQGITVPNFAVNVALRLIRGSVKRQANFDIKHISPIAHADKCFIPALFVAGEHDDFIDKRHSEAIHARYAGDKNLIIVEGDHNSPRPKFMFDSASIFLQTCLQIPNSWALRVHPGMNLMAPPWFFPGVVGGPGHGISSPRKNSSRRPRPQHGESRASNTRPSAPSPDTSEEMGMTLERQREIQASLFRMLGQAEDTPTQTSPSTSSSDNMNSSNSSKKTYGSEVTHSTTFPPRNASAMSSASSAAVKSSNHADDSDNVM